MITLQKRLRGRTAIILLAVLLMLITIPMADAKASEPADIGRCTILVIDSSSSMRTASDPRRVAIEAAKLYIDYNETQDSSVAVIAFGSTVKESTGFIDASDMDMRGRLKDSIDKIKYTGFTDIGAAMKEAQTISEQWIKKNPDKSDAVMVLLLSDGLTDMSDNSPKTIDMSNAERDEAVNYFEDNGIPIYTIGLDAGSALNREDLQDMADRTDALYFATSDASELPDIMTAIFADSRALITDGSVIEFKADGENYYTCTITIPNPSILESNILIRYGQKLADTQLIDPDGNEIDLLNDEKVASSASNTYTLIKLLRPAVGEWQLKVKGAKDDDIIITLTNNFSLAATMTVSPDQSALKVHDVLSVTSTLETAAKDLEINELTYMGLSANMVFADSQGNVLSKTPMSFDSASGVMHVETELLEPGEFQIWCEYDSDYLQRQSEPVSITVSNSAPALSGELSEYRFKVMGNGAGKEFVIDDLLGKYTDPEGCKLTMEPVSYDASVADIVVQSSEVLVRVQKAGTTDFEYLIRDDHGETVSGVVSITVTNILILILIIAGALLLVIIVLLLVLKGVKNKKNGYWNGSLTANVEIRRGDQTERYNYSQPDMGKFLNRKLSLYEALIDSSGARANQDADEALRKVVIGPAQGGGAMSIDCQGRREVLEGSAFSTTSLEINTRQAAVKVELRYIVATTNRSTF